jgi:hypothetical protein
MGSVIFHLVARLWSLLDSSVVSDWRAEARTSGTKLYHLDFLTIAMGIARAAIKAAILLGFIAGVYSVSL